jgi:hypothetical protein
LKTIKIEFLKISYDRILTSNGDDYCATHPEVDIHQAIDIIRGKADQDYLDAVTFYCKSNDDENQANSDFIVKQIIYLDRNNTPDVWPDIGATIKKAYAGSATKTFKTVIIVPEQH